MRYSVLVCAFIVGLFACTLGYSNELSNTQKLNRARASELYKQAQSFKRANNLQQYNSSLKEAFDLGSPAAVIEYTEAFLTQKRTARITNLSENIRKLEELTKQDPREDFTIEQRAHVQYLLGYIYLHGLSVNFNRTEAMRYFLLAAAHSSSARFELVRLTNQQRLELIPGIDGDMLLLFWALDNAEESVIPEDLFSDKMYLRRYLRTLDALAAKGDVNVMFYLAKFYLNGKFTPVSSDLALKYLKKASLSHHPQATLLLANLLYSGKFAVKQDENAAYGEYKKAFLYPETANAAAEKLAAICKGRKETASACRYLMYLQRYTEAYQLVKQDTSFSKNNPLTLYLEAMSYRQESQKEQLFDESKFLAMMNQAIIDGSENAILDRLLTQAPESKAAVDAKLRILQKDSPEDLYATAVLIIRSLPQSGIKPEEVLLLLEQSARFGHLKSLNLLAVAYRKGASVLNVKPDSKRADGYIMDILKYDHACTTGKWIYNALQSTSASDRNLAIRFLTTQKLAMSKLLGTIPDTTENLSIKLFLYSICQESLSKEEQKTYVALMQKYLDRK